MTRPRFLYRIMKEFKPEVGLNETFYQRIDDKNINYVLYRYMVGDFHFFQNVRNLVLEKKYFFMKMGKKTKKLSDFPFFFLKRVFFSKFQISKNKF